MGGRGRGNKPPLHCGSGRGSTRSGTRSTRSSPGKRSRSSDIDPGEGPSSGPRNANQAKKQKTITDAAIVSLLNDPGDSDSDDIDIEELVE